MFSFWHNCKLNVYCNALKVFPEFQIFFFLKLLQGHNIKNSGSNFIKRCRHVSPRLLINKFSLQCLDNCALSISANCFFSSANKANKLTPNHEGLLISAQYTNYIDISIQHQRAFLEQKRTLTKWTRWRPPIHPKMMQMFLLKASVA